MEKIYKNNNILFKIIPCILIAIYVFTFLLGSTVHATSYTCEQFPQNTIITPEIYDNSTYHVIYVYWSGYWASARLFFSDEPIRVEITYDERNGYTGILFGSTVTGQSIRFFEKNLSDGWDFSNETEFKNGGINTSLPSGLAYGQDFPLEIKNYLADCNCDVYDEKTGEVVFQGASQEELAGVTIPAIRSAEEIPQAIIKTMKVVIPVGLVILGIGLVIYLIKSVILRIQ